MYSVVIILIKNSGMIMSDYRTNEILFLVFQKAFSTLRLESGQ